MKKILAIILVAVMLFTLAACGKKQETGSGENPATGTETPSTNTQTDAAPEKEVIEGETEEKEPEKKPEEKPAEKDEKPAEKPEEKPAEKDEKPAEKPEEKPAEPTPSTAGNTLLSDFKSKAGSYSDAYSLAEALSQNSIIPFMAAAMPVEPGYLAGFDNEIGGFKEGATFMPMIGSIPFVGYVFILEDGADVSAFISTLKQNANLRWNICVEAEEMVTGSAGNKVFFVMTNKSFEE